MVNIAERFSQLYHVPYEPVDETLIDQFLSKVLT